VFKLLNSLAVQIFNYYTFLLVYNVVQYLIQCHVYIIELPGVSVQRIKRKTLLKLTAHGRPLAHPVF